MFRRPFKKPGVKRPNGENKSAALSSGILEADLTGLKEAMGESPQTVFRRFSRELCLVYVRGLVNEDIINRDILAHLPEVLPVLSKRGEDDVEISGLAVFRKDRMVGKFDQDQMKYLTLLRGDKARGVITYFQPGTEDVRVALFGTNSRKVDVELVDDKAYINIDIFLRADIIEAQKNYMFNEDLERFQLTKEGAQDYIESRCGEVLTYLQNNYQVDALNTGAAARARYGKEIELLDWDRIFAGADITVNAHVKIRNYGALFAYLSKKR